MHDSRCETREEGDGKMRRMMRRKRSGGWKADDGMKNEGWIYGVMDKGGRLKDEG